MIRSLDALEAQEFDVAVIGGGVHGAAIAWDAALRGLSVALIEKSDFGAATSHGCFRIVHGGLRYLQHLNFQRLRESVREQRILGMIAPHLVRPLPFLVPCYGYGMRGKEVLALAAALYELLALDRNVGVDAAHVLQRARLLNKDECLSYAPGLRQEGLRGGLLYCDAQISHCDRLTFLFAKSAASAGAVVANYLRVEELGCESSSEASKLRVREIKCLDEMTGRATLVRARQVVNAAGPWIERVLSSLSHHREPVNVGNLSREVFSQGVQLVLPGTLTSVALAVESAERDSQAFMSRGGRSYFLVPWEGQTLVGTEDSVFTGDPDGFRARSEDGEHLLREVALAYPAFANVPRERIQYLFGGLRPVPRQSEDRLRQHWRPGDGVDVAHESEIRDHSVANPGDVGIENLLSVVGVKYTTARALAEHVVDRIVRRVSGGTNHICQSARRPLLGGAGLAEAQPTQDPVRLRIRAEYGSEALEIEQLLEDSPELAQTFSGVATTYAEVIYGVRHEMAVRLSDVVLRRTSMGIRGFPGLRALREVCEVLRGELGWDDVRCKEELAATRAAYPGWISSAELLR